LSFAATANPSSWVQWAADVSSLLRPILYSFARIFDVFPEAVSGVAADTDNRQQTHEQEQENEPLSNNEWIDFHCAQH